MKHRGFFLMFSYFAILFAKGRSLCLGASYIRQVGGRLRCGIFKTLNLNMIECQEECTATINCFSANTYQNDNGTEICELVRGTRDSFQNKSCFGMEAGKEYNELKVCWTFRAFKTFTEN